MKVYRHLDELPGELGPTIVSVGNYDGVHMAHRRVLGELVRRAQETKCASVVVTFDPHPTRILRPDVAPRLLTPVPVKLRLLEETGIDAVLLLPFTRDLSLMTPLEFAEQVLLRGLRAREVHEGFNFHFGHRAQGNVERLAEIGREFGFEVRIYPALTIRGEVVSSSRIRELLGAGEVSRARHLLGRVFNIFSTPGRGRGYGQKYTVPTINLSRYDEMIPRNGVYITRTAVNGETFDSVTNVGVRPTFGPDSFAIESHLLNFHPITLTAQTQVELCFLKRLRDEQKFPTVEALREQIGRDVGRAKKYFQLLGRR
ncbi:MAG TPA: bifunctional riboflavin kinase/FAD synthetase [Terriglobales bacterium]|jgi:riboflavin kinase/FMN adenylyltransferase|nr:bifunctional riboflavin kinase/FAD synthetase [Terriglobales bacterium]